MYSGHCKLCYLRITQGSNCIYINYTTVVSMKSHLSETRQIAHFTARRVPVLEYVELSDSLSPEAT